MTQLSKKGLRAVAEIARRTGFSQDAVTVRKVRIAVGDMAVDGSTGKRVLSLKSEE